MATLGHSQAHLATRARGRRGLVVTVTLVVGLVAPASGRAETVPPPATDTATPPAPDAPPAVAADPAAAAAPDETAAATATTTPPARPWLKQHALGVGYRALMFRTADGDRYTLTGPTLAYSYFLGRRRGLLLRVEACDLVVGAMHGPSGEFSGGLGPLYDQRHLGFDAMALASRRFTATPKVAITAAFGLQLQGFSLAGTRYSPVEDVSLGLGALGQVDYALNHWLALSVQVTGGLHIFDLVDHHNPVSWVVPTSSSFAIAARH